MVNFTLVDEEIRSLELDIAGCFSNVAPVLFCDGLVFEVFTVEAQLLENLTTQNPYDREHVTPYLCDPATLPQPLCSIKWFSRLVAGP